MDAPAWERQPYLQELDTEVLATGEGPDGPWAVLADTVLYPEGGGQPSDQGRIGDVAVREVRRTPKGVIHRLAAPLSPGPVTVRLDWLRRFDHMQQHTAQHLLTALAQDRFGWPTTAFHLGQRVSDIELDVPALSQDQLQALEEAAAAEIRRARWVRCRRVAPEALAALPVRTRGLPAEHTGEVRLVEIEGIDVNTCGGTHVANLCELESVVVLGAEPMRGGSRVFFAAGRRVRALLRDHLDLAAQLRAVLAAPNHELVAVARTKLEALHNAERLVRRLQEAAADALGEQLAAQTQRFTCRHLENEEMHVLQRTARRFAALAPTSVLLLTSASPAGGLFCLAAGAHCPVDLAALAHAFAAAVGGRAGGSGRLYQGKAPSLAERERGIAAVQRLLGS